jgi:hypothetical protein
MNRGTALGDLLTRCPAAAAVLDEAITAEWAALRPGAAGPPTLDDDRRVADLP